MWYFAWILGVLLAWLQSQRTERLVLVFLIDNASALDQYAGAVDLVVYGFSAQEANHVMRAFLGRPLKKGELHGQLQKEGSDFDYTARDRGVISPGKEFLEAGKKRLAGDTARAATSDEVKELRRETAALKEVVAELTLENRLLKKSVTGDGEDGA